MVLYLIIYISGTINICLGSNSSYYNTPFDYVGAEWYCKKFDLKAYTVEKFKMRIVSKNGEMDFYLRRENHLYAKVFTSDYYSIESEYYISRITSYKQWWTIWGFSLDLPDKNNQEFIAHFKRVR